MEQTIYFIAPLKIPACEIFEVICIEILVHFGDLRMNFLRVGCQSANIPNKYSEWLGRKACTA